MRMVCWAHFWRAACTRGEPVSSPSARSGSGQCFLGPSRMRAGHGLQSTSRTRRRHERHHRRSIGARGRSRVSTALPHRRLLEPTTWILCSRLSTKGRSILQSTGRWASAPSRRSLRTVLLSSARTSARASDLPRCSAHATPAARRPPHMAMALHTTSTQTATIT
eukprot:Amastigsp_a679049_13.p5 type:complete len:165 gc:universal Amastigsp_a679049_13:140-634(+)